MNDRSLRKITIGLGGTGNGIPRETGFDITAASEVMAIFVFKEYEDLKRRLGNIFIGLTMDKQPIYRDLKAGCDGYPSQRCHKTKFGAATEGNPAIIHGGPFANIAQGTNTILATNGNVPV